MSLKKLGSWKWCPKCHGKLILTKRLEGAREVGGTQEHVCAACRMVWREEIRKADPPPAP